MTFLKRFQDFVRSELIINNNFLILYDASSLYSDFVRPYVSVHDENRPDNRSDKHERLAKMPIKIVVTRFSRNQCVTKLMEKKDYDIGVAEQFVDRALSENKNIFFSTIVNDSEMTCECMNDFKQTEENGKYEDSLYISTANFHKIPIVTNESHQGKISLWKKHCKHSVINLSKFWTFVNSISPSMTTKYEITKSFLKI